MLFCLKVFTFKLRFRLSWLIIVENVFCTLSLLEAGLICRNCHKVLPLTDDLDLTV